MADGILFDIAGRIIEGLGNEAIKELNLLWGAPAELEKLKKTVSAIQAVLLHAEEQRAVNNPEVTDWIEKLKDVVYDADDLLDGVSTECLLREMMTRDKMAKQVRIFFSKSNKLYCDLKMGHEIKAIREKLDAIDKDRKTFYLEERLVDIGVRARKRDDSHYYVPKEEVIGRDDAKKEIIDILLSDSNVKENVGILPITGLGGFGKTTLAQFIFNDEEIDKHFQLKMWACVSNTFDVQKVVEKIIESATNKKPESVEMNTLVRLLLNEISAKKYLIVLDDVWNEDDGKWDELRKLLMSGARGSRILVTTRSGEVARITHTIEPYALLRLDSQKSWCLFKKVAFENGEEPVNPRKVEVGKKIVKKCLGVPLVIKTIGRSLLEKSEAEWDSFEKNKMQKIKENKIIPTLKLSYDQLPSHLKQCFAYCSLFPKDYVMKKSRLIELWMAQGLIIKPSNQNEYLEDVGNEYFMNLLWRSFFQEAEMDDLGNVITCKMHDLMHDLAMSVAGSLITILDSEEKSISEKTRHVSVIDNREFSFVIPTSSSNASRIRTLLSLGRLKDLQESSTSSCEAILSSLKFLRVLDLHGRKLDLVQSSIYKLKQLRDLDLSDNDKIEKLPDSICELQNLYTLRLSRCTSLKELPRGITKLVNLRHLYIEDCDNLSYMPRGLGQLTNLQILSNFVVHWNSALKDSCRLSELNRLTSLRGELTISGLRSGEDVALDYKGENLKDKEHLQILTLRWSRENDNASDEMALEGLEPHPNLKTLRIDEYGGVRFTTWLSSLTNLVDLRLRDCEKLKYLSPLSQLLSLRRIELKGLEEIEYISDCSDNMNEFYSSSSSALFFPSLEAIDFNWCRNLKGWWRRSHSYNADVNTLPLPSFPPRLSKLRISSCPMLTSLPMFPHLQERLWLNEASWKAVQQTITNVSSSSASSTPIPFPSPPLSKLKELKLIKVEDLETLPEDGLQNLVSLQHLQIESCPKLKSLSQGVQYLTALHELHLYDCPMLDLGNDEQHGMQWKGLKSLISLRFENIQKLVSLPMGLQHVTTLRKLQISRCSSLFDIPEWICNWPSLENFTIYSCSGLTSLPEAMGRLNSLRILDCPILLQTCEQDKGENWPKITHIPKLDF